MFILSDSIFLKKETLTEKSRDELLNYFNTKDLPIDLALSADVRHLPSTDRERVLFGHPFNLFDEIKGEFDSGKADAVSISFNKQTGITQICLGLGQSVILNLANTRIKTDER